MVNSFNGLISVRAPGIFHIPKITTVNTTVCRVIGCQLKSIWIGLLHIRRIKRLPDRRIQVSAVLTASGCTDGNVQTWSCVGDNGGVYGGVGNTPAGGPVEEDMNRQTNCRWAR